MHNAHQQIPLTVLAPESLDSMSPLCIIDSSSNVKGAFVERYAIEHLDEQWRNSCGYYILFSHMNSNNSFEAYVGKASNGFHRRLKDHNETKDYWRTALLICRAGELGFTSTESAFLEGRMRDILDLSSHVTVHNIAPTGDRTLPAWEENAMEKVILSTLRMMFLRGYRNASMGAVADNIAFSPVPQKEIFIPENISQPPIGKPGVADDYAVKTFENLKTWRLEKARERKVSPFIVFTNKELEAIIQAKPENINHLTSIPGIGSVKRDLYGEDIIRIINC